MCTAPGDDDGPRPTAAVKEEERTLSAGDGAALREFVALPATGFRRGAVLIIHDIWGYTDFYKDLARRITGHGRAQQLSNERFLADMQTAVDDLHARGAGKVACWGFCMGGRLAYVSAARVGGLAGAVAYYGHLQAEPGRLSPLQLAGEIRVPILGIFGGADPGIPADQIAAFQAALKTDKEIVTYPGAPHGFLRYGATEHKAAIDDALQRTYRFFAWVLAAPASGR